MMQNPVVEAILTRASARDGFLPDLITQEIVGTIVSCGLAAPSSKNAQPWRFHVVSSSESLRRLAAAVNGSEELEDYVPHDPRTGRPWPEYSSSVRESARTLQECAVAIFIENRGVFSRGRAVLAEAPEWNMIGQLVGYGFEMIGIGAAIQNMLLATHALGLQGIFMGDVLIAENEISSHLGIEGDLQGVIAIGYGPPRQERRAEVQPREDSLQVIWH